MAEVKWIKITTDIFDNRKIRQIESMPDGDALVVIWLKLLILAGIVNDGGAVYFTQDIPYTDQLLATQFGRPLHTVQLALATFRKFGMIEIVDDIIMVSNWEKYQNVGGMERIREQNRIRKQKQREREKMKCIQDGYNLDTQMCDCHVTSLASHATDKDIDKEKEEDIDKEIEREKKTAKRFTPPTVEEVRKYCEERKNGVDPERFVDFYASKGWKVGQNGMKDWKACVRTWERRNTSGGRIGANGVKLTNDQTDVLDGIL